jgi:hypothetical protein
METCPSVLHLAKRLLAPGMALVLAMIFAVPILILAVKVVVIAIIASVAWIPVHSLVVGRDGWWARTTAWRRTARSNFVLAFTISADSCLAIANAVASVVRSVGAVLIEVACGATVGLLAAFAALGPGDHLGFAVLIGSAAGVCVCVGRRADA